MMHGFLRTVRVDGADMTYFEQGDGPPVVLVHGSNSDHRIWSQHCEALSVRYRVIAVSQRYFGTAPWTDDGERFNLSTLADDLGTLVEMLDAGPVTIVGWSFGAAVALTMAVRRRELVQRMFLFEPSLATFVIDPEKTKAALADRLDMMSVAKAHAASGDLAGAVRMFMDGVNADAGAFDRLAPDVKVLMTENARMLPLLFAGPPPPSVTAADLQGLEIPVAIGLGQDSRIAYQIAARTAASLLPLGQLTIVGKARHLWPIQEPREFCRLLLDFLDQKGRECIHQDGAPTTSPSGRQ